MLLDVLVRCSKLEAQRIFCTQRAGPRGEEQEVGRGRAAAELCPSRILQLLLAHTVVPQWSPAGAAIW